VVPVAKATRMTKQKKLILDILRSTKCHPSADWIYEQARKQITDISLGTVYRNLNVLMERGEILELNFGSTYSRFDGNPDNHYHFVCERCHNLFDIEVPVHDGLNKMVQDTMGFIVSRHRMEFYGTCMECQKAL